MPIPSFTNDGVLPPFLGQEPGEDPSLMSPYEATVTEVVSRFAITDNRRRILRGWLDHRSALRTAGIECGFQWLDGSFLEAKEPNDIDVTSFVRRPPSVTHGQQWGAIAAAHPQALHRAVIKQTFRVDALFVDLDGTPETIVTASRYYSQLFSHQRASFLWKGMLQVRLENPTDDANALVFLTASSYSAPPVAGAATSTGANP